MARAIFDADHEGGAKFGVTLTTHTNDWRRLDREDHETAEGYRHAARRVLRVLRASSPKRRTGAR